MYGIGGKRPSDICAHFFLYFLGDDDMASFSFLLALDFCADKQIKDCLDFCKTRTLLLHFIIIQNAKLRLLGTQTHKNQTYFRAHPCLPMFIHAYAFKNVFSLTKNVNLRASLISQSYQTFHPFIFCLQSRTFWPQKTSLAILACRSCIIS